MQTPGRLSKDVYEYSSSLAPSTPGLALLSLLGPPPCPLTGADSKVQVTSSKRCPHITTDHQSGAESSLGAFAHLSFCLVETCGYMELTGRSF